MICFWSSEDEPCFELSKFCWGLEDSHNEGLKRSKLERMKTGTRVSIVVFQKDSDRWVNKLYTEVHSVVHVLIRFAWLIFIARCMSSVLRNIRSFVLMHSSCCFLSALSDFCVQVVSFTLAFCCMTFVFSSSCVSDIVFSSGCVSDIVFSSSCFSGTAFYWQCCHWWDVCFMVKAFIVCFLALTDFCNYEVLDSWSWSEVTEF